uniref:Protein MTO1 homolog, mitochondrial n=1 Tax=Angiostrongylus cantonensis TaxID=6313 RepID=A0A158PB30_ANGCA
LCSGGGHAGCEAASAAARCGARTALLTHSRNTIGEMSCNPSFGGIGKGHLIRELDALDGVCGRICDLSAITYQALNRGQGPAVLGLRAQIDRLLYKSHMQKEIFSTYNLEVIEGDVRAISTEIESDLRISGVTLEDGRNLRSKAVVIATGTFLGGEIFVGNDRWSSGRIGEKSGTSLSKSFRQLGFHIGRLRTGTPPRLVKDTIDLSKFQLMPPDVVPIPFSFMTDEVWLLPSQQLPTYLGYTNDRVREIVEENLADKQYIQGEVNGPRYCPSLESKVIRFPNLNHRVFLEHEGLESDLIYPQGMSMTFSPDIQLKIMRSIKGLEKYGYGVHYDFVDPKQLSPTLETKLVKGLFLAGQVNGTTGYEEAAAQGVVAGINAAARTREKEGMVIRRSQDNADMRLTELGRKWGSVGDARWSRFLASKRAIDTLTSELKDIRMSLAKWSQVFPSYQWKNPAKVLSAYEMVHRHNVSLGEMKTAFFDRLGHCIPNNFKNLEERIRCEGSYEAAHERMKVKMQEIDRESNTLIPDDIDYNSLPGLSMECQEKLDSARPLSLGAASRLPGVTPEAIITVLRYLKRPSKLSQSG